MKVQHQRIAPAGQDFTSTMARPTQELMIASYSQFTDITKAWHMYTPAHCIIVLQRDTTSFSIIVCHALDVSTEISNGISQRKAQTVNLDDMMPRTDQLLAQQECYLHSLT